jgi:hypothetical protein
LYLTLSEKSKLISLAKYLGVRYTMDFSDDEYDDMPGLLCDNCGGVCLEGGELYEEQEQPCSCMVNSLLACSPPSPN